jgi:mercuric ion binding protein
MTFSRLRTIAFALSLLFIVPPTAGGAGEPTAVAAESRVVRVRILGLFSPARVEALREAFGSIEDAALKKIDYETAHATFEIRSDKAWKDVPAEKLPERIDQALRQASRSTFSAAPASETPPDRLEEAAIAAGGCACRACELAAYEAVAKVEGVERATVSFAESSIVVRFDRERTNRPAIEEALKKRGVTLLPSAP